MNNINWSMNNLSVGSLPQDQAANGPYMLGSADKTITNAHVSIVNNYISDVEIQYTGLEITFSNHDICTNVTQVLSGHVCSRNVHNSHNFMHDDFIEP